MVPDRRNRLRRLLTRQPDRRWVVGLTVALQFVFLALLGKVPSDPRESLGLPGGVAVLLSVIAGAIAGPLAGVVTAVAGGLAFILFESRDSTAWATVVGIALWVLAALLAGLLSRVLRDEVSQREARLEEERRLESSLNEMGALLTSSLDSDEILHRAVRLLAESLPCDASAVALRAEGWWRLLVAWNMPPDVLTTAFDQRQVPHAERAFREGRPVQVIEDPAQPGRVSPVLSRLGLRSTLIVPLVVHGQREGALFLSFQTEPHEFTEREQAFAVRAASRLGQALENARLYERLRDIAVTLQTSLSRAAPEVEGLQIDLHRRIAYRPQLVGGDFADVFRGEGHVDIVIGDVEGKGVAASALAETVRSSIRAVAPLEASPGFVLAHVNRVLIEERATQYCTALLLRLDTRTGGIVLASAGHPAPVCAGPRGARFIEPAYGPPLGAFDVSYEETTAVMQPDEVLVLYTDGLTEARAPGGELFGEERVLRVLEEASARSAREASLALREAVERFAPDLRDDLELLAVSFAAAASGRSEAPSSGAPGGDGGVVEAA